jgi:hypothetical protein
MQLWRMRRGNVLLHQMVAYAKENTAFSKQLAPTKNSLAPIEVPVPTTPIYLFSLQLVQSR